MVVKLLRIKVWLSVNRNKLISNKYISLRSFFVDLHKVVFYNASCVTQVVPNIMIKFISCQKPFRRNWNGATDQKFVKHDVSKLLRRIPTTSSFERQVSGHDFNVIQICFVYSCFRITDEHCFLSLDIQVFEIQVFLQTPHSTHKNYIT